MTDDDHAFVARFTSDCAECVGRIVEGDTVRWLDGSVVHADCADVQSKRPLPDPCPVCHMVPAVPGACGCD